MSILELDQYEKHMDHDKKEYTGQLVSYVEKPIDHVITQAYTCINNIRARCKKNPDYIGLDVGFTTKQFVYWWIVQNRFFKMKRPSVGRINHKKGYTLDNIEIQSLNDNSKEARYRCGSTISPIKIKMIKNNKEIAIANSMRQAATFSSMDLRSVQNVLRGVRPSVRGWSFEIHKECV